MNFFYYSVLYGVFLLATLIPRPGEKPARSGIDEIERPLKIPRGTPTSYGGPTTRGISPQLPPTPRISPPDKRENELKPIELRHHAFTPTSLALSLLFRWFLCSSSLPRSSLALADRSRKTSVRWASQVSAERRNNPFFIQKFG